MAERLAKKVLIIGWDAADWNIIHPLMDKGQMPTLEKLVNGGVMGNIATLDPPLSPMLWTSIGTGKTADKHGIMGFIEPDPVTSDMRPVYSTSRKVKAVWNILTQKGYKTHVVGWWPSHPAEPINGISISNFYKRATKPFGEPWPMAEGTVHPKELEETFKELRIHPGELTEAHILPFVPDAAKVDPEGDDKGLQAVAINLADCSTIQSAATWIMENKDWDFMAVYFDAIDHFCHAFMKFYPPKMNGIPDDRFELYKDVIKGAYRFHDMMLERLLELAGPDTTVILLSDHGFYSNHLRPKVLPKEHPAAPALEHSPYGILCMNGPNIQKDEQIYGASVLDITPTVLTLFGLPVGRDMDGKVLVQAFDKKVVPDYIPSWEEVEGECGMHPKEQQSDPWAAQAAMKQLIELGYVEAPEGDKATQLKKVQDETQFYLARVYMHAHKYAEALPVLEKLYEENPDVARFALKLASCYHILYKLDKCRVIIDKIREGMAQEKDSPQAKQLPHVDFLEGVLLIAENKPRRALNFLKEAEKSVPHLPNLHIQVGNAYLKIQRWADSERAYIKALAIDEDSAVAHHGLALAYLRQEKYHDAIEECLTAIGLAYNMPLAHYHLGEALLKIGDFERSAQAFQVCVSLSPGNKRAHQWLVRLFSNELKNPELAAHHSKFIEERIKGTITLVSGLPRSGTSMMMQMLKNGGLDILTDEVRKEDNNNPKGYLEYEKVKRLHLDKSWLGEADGKVLKIVAPLLFHLPGKYDYRIIFMQRDMEEVLRSQQIMLGKQKAVDQNAFPMTLSEGFKKQLEKAESWIQSQPNVSVLYVNYADVVNNPEEQAENINSFLGGELNIEGMLSSVDKQLYRNKANPTPQS